MKKTIAILSLAVFLGGCAGTEKPSEKTSANAPPATAVNRVDTTSPNANRAANNSAQMPKSGERIEQALEINFKDGLPKGWEVTDPERDNPSVFEFNGASFRLKIPSGKDLYGENMTAPRLLKSVSGDFEIETRVKFSPVESYQGAGLLIFRNDNNYLRLERGYGGTGGGESGIRFDRREDETYEPVAMPDQFPTSAGVVELKFRRSGGEFTAFWREAGKTQWVEVGKAATSYPETVQIGLIGVSTAGDIAAEFAYVKLTPAAK